MDNQHRVYEDFKRDLKQFLLTRTQLDEDEIDDLVLFVGAQAITPRHIRRPAVDQIIGEASEKIRDLLRTSEKANYN